jgi:DNA-binding response OmpR family regulator
MPTPLPTPLPSSPCVLLVEDHPDTLRFLARLLRMQGFSVREAATCAEARAAVERDPCHVLVCDVALPDGSGLDLMRELRGRGLDIRGVAVSGYATPEDARAAREAGFERHMAKPFHPDELAALLRAMFT